MCPSATQPSRASPRFTELPESRSPSCSEQQEVPVEVDGCRGSLLFTRVLRRRILGRPHTGSCIPAVLWGQDYLSSALALVPACQVGLCPR
jgi:hypothetical protein